MNTKIIIAIVLIVLVVRGVSLLLNSKPKANTSTTQPPSGETQTTNNITIEQFSFKPSTLTVKVGTTVTWMNKDSVNHTIKSDSFNSPNLSQGDKFEFTFTTKGTFDYICGVHPSMRGRIIVE